MGVFAWRSERRNPAKRRDRATMACVLWVRRPILLRVTHTISVSAGRAARGARAHSRRRRRARRRAGALVHGRDAARRAARRGARRGVRRRVPRRRRVSDHRGPRRGQLRSTSAGSSDERAARFPRALLSAGTSDLAADLRCDGAFENRAALLPSLAQVAPAAEHAM